MKKTTALVNDSAGRGHFIDDYLAYLLSQASQAVSNEFRACLAEADVSVIEWRVLSTLSDHPQISVGRLSDIVMCKQPTLSKAIDRMEAKGWVTRSLKITNELLVKAKELEESELSGFSSKEIQSLKETLRNLIRHCSDKRVLDDSSKAAEQLDRADSDNRSVTG